MGICCIIEDAITLTVKHSEEHFVSLTCIKKNPYFFMKFAEYGVGKIGGYIL